MTRTTVTRTIESLPAEVFDAVAHIERFAEVVDDITDVEFISESTRGVGTRFRETRLMRGRPSTTELEVTEYQPDHRVRLVSDQGGTIWDTVFEVEPAGAASRLTMTMDARPYKLLAKVTTPLFKGVIARAIESDMDAVKRYCER
ncbi:MAG: SRPBCC family protein [Acidimicrobiales bacterium]